MSLSIRLLVVQATSMPTSDSGTAGRINKNKQPSRVSAASR